MKRIVMLFMFCGLMLTALADWTYGTAYFQGSQPSSCLNHGGVMIWYDGDLKQTGLNGGVEIWERLRVGELAREWAQATSAWPIQKTTMVPRCVSSPKAAPCRFSFRSKDLLVKRNSLK